MDTQTSAPAPETPVTPPEATTPSAPAPELTYGEKAVGLTFNPSGDLNVAKIKGLYAQIIDLLAETNPDNTETGLRGRILGRAINEAIGAQMWAVKAVTFKE